jgi:hypothetical protein
VDTGLLLTILGSATGVAAVAIAYLQLREQRKPKPPAPSDPPGHAPSKPQAHVPPAAAHPRGEQDGQPVRADRQIAARRVWNVPAPNRGFTGRDGLLEKLREQLHAGHGAAVLVLRGMGGVGKSQLATEFAHRFASDYDIVWWIEAEQPELIGPAVAALAVELGCVPQGADTGPSVSAAMAELRARGRWLLVFDNAVSAAALNGWLPGSTAGHMLITSRAGGWDEIAETIDIDVFDRAESVMLLQARMPSLSADDASKLADALGDLPLGLAQAAQYLVETGMPPGEYLNLLNTCAGKILGESRLALYPRSLAAATQLEADRLEAEDPAAMTLLILCAFLAPEQVPMQLISAAVGDLPEPLASRAADPIAFRRMLAAISRSALARVSENSLQMHRVTQAILRDRLTAEQTTAARAASEAIVIAGDPGDRTDPGKWPYWAQLMPHLLAISPASTNLAILDLAAEAARQKWRSGDTRGTEELAGKLYLEWRERLGDDDPHTLSASESLGDVAWDQGRFADAQKIDEDTLARRRRVLGDDHPDTLTSASSLAADFRKLGKFQAARDLQEDTLDRRRRVLGDDHPDTLHSARDLAASLSKLGDARGAEKLDEDALARCRRTVGDDHPDTLTSASFLARDFRKLGKLQDARNLQQDTLARRRRVLGDDHPDTLRSVRDLAATLRELGDARGAQKQDEDALARSRRILGDDNPDTLTSVSSLAADLRKLGRPREAYALLQDTLARRRRVLGDDHPDTLRSAQDLAATLHELGSTGRLALFVHATTDRTLQRVRRRGTRATPPG